MRCTTHLVSCLRKKGIEPKTNSSGVFDNRKPENALEYNTSKHFHSAFSTSNQWWSVDLMREVKIIGYKIMTGNGCNYVSNWSIHLSLDDANYFKVDAQSGVFPTTTKYSLDRIYRARYLKIFGNSPTCKERASYVNILAFDYIEIYGDFIKIIKFKYNLKVFINILIIILS